MADRYREHPSLAIFDRRLQEPNPLPLAPLPDMDLSESEEEVELDNNGYVGWEEDEGGEGGSDGSENMDRLSPGGVRETASRLLNRELPQPPQFIPFNHPAPEHAREVK